MVDEPGKLLLDAIELFCIVNIDRRGACGTRQICPWAVHLTGHLERAVSTPFDHQALALNSKGNLRSFRWRFADNGSRLYRNGNRRI